MATCIRCGKSCNDNEKMCDDCKSWFQAKTGGQVVSPAGNNARKDSTPKPEKAAEKSVESTESKQNRQNSNKSDGKTKYILIVSLVAFFIVFMIVFAIADRKVKYNGEPSEDKEIVTAETENINEDSARDSEEKASKTETETINLVAVSVGLAIEKKEASEKGILTGYAEDGTTAWVYKTDSYEYTELERITLLEVREDTVYLADDQTIKAFALADGNLIWENADFDGANPAHVFDDSGNLYICGYYGPDLLAIDPEGKTLTHISSFTEEAWWPSYMRIEGDYLYIFMEEPSCELQVSLSDYSGVLLDENVNASSEVKQITMSNITGVAASSSLSEYDLTHSPDRLIDNDITKGWCEGVSGTGVGEYVLFSLDSICMVNELTIWNGYQKKDSLYSKNARVASLKLEFSDGASEMIAVSDSKGAQTISFPQHNTSFIKVTIASIYSGTTYEDTVISEIDFSYSHPDISQEEISGMEAFWGIWCVASKNKDDLNSAVDKFNNVGIKATIIVSTDWSNLNSEKWYVLTAGMYSTENEAEAMLDEVRKYYSDAYVKYSGSWQDGN